MAETESLQQTLEIQAPDLNLFTNHALMRMAKDSQVDTWTRSDLNTWEMLSCTSEAQPAYLIKGVSLRIQQSMQAGDQEAK